MAWHKQLLVARSGAVEVTCAQCGGSMYLPPSKVGKYTRCSAECIARSREEARQRRERNCLTCGAVFNPRQSQLTKGHGRYCSQACNTASRAALNSDEAFEKRIQRIRELRSTGAWTVLRGDANPRWRGGVAAAKRRVVESGRAAEQCRRYRAKHPHKAREWAQNRKNRKLGRLEYGTIPAIGARQKWKCAICRTGIKTSYTVDHIVPLKLGGIHAARNIQLLCNSCNCRKSAKDPIEYMQQLGRLL